MRNFTLTLIILSLLSLDQVLGQSTQPTSQPTTQASTQPTSQPNSSAQELGMQEEVLKKNSEYEITYPANWELDESGTMGTKFILFSSPSSANDEFKENINYMVQDISAYGLDLDAFVSLTMDQIKQFITNAVVVGNEKQTDKNGKTFQKIEYKGDQGAYKLHFLQHIYVENGKAQFITFTAEQDQFDNYKSLAEGIFSTLVRK